MKHIVEATGSCGNTMLYVIYKPFFLLFNIYRFAFFEKIEWNTKDRKYFLEILL